MRRSRHEPQHFDDRLWQLALRRNLSGKLRKQFHIRQLAVEQKKDDFLKACPLRHFMNVIAAIHQSGIWIDRADLGFAGDNARQTRAVLWYHFIAHLVSLTLAALR